MTSFTWEKSQKVLGRPIWVLGSLNWAFVLGFKGPALSQKKRPGGPNKKEKIKDENKIKNIKDKNKDK